MIPKVDVSLPRIQLVTTTPGEDRIRWIEQRLRIPETGAPFVVQDFHKEFITNSFSLKPDGSRRYSRAILTCGRKNAKTTICCAMSIAELCGPWTQGYFIPIASVNRDAAGAFYKQAAKMATKSGLIAAPGNTRTRLKKRDSIKSLINQQTGGELKSLSSDATSSIAEIPGGLIFIDELGWHKKRDLYDAMDTSRGALNPLMIVIGTLGPIGSILNDLIELHKRHPLAHQYVQIYSAPLDADPFDPAMWYMANPGLGTILELSEFEEDAEEARYNKKRLASFKHLQLNIPATPGIEDFIGAEAWKLGNDSAPAEGPCYLGLDLSQTTDLTALCMYWPETGRIDFIIYTVKNGLSEREGTDNIPYSELPPGQLRIVGNRIINYAEVAADLKMLAGEFDVQGLAADPWKIKVLMDTMEEGGMEFANWEDDEGTEEIVGNEFPPITQVRQNIEGMTGAIDELDRRLRNGQIKHGNSLLLQRSLSSAKVFVDGNLNRKFMKSQSSGRIDPAVAAAMAIGLAHDRLRTLSDKEQQRRDAMKALFEAQANNVAEEEFNPSDFSM